VSVMEHEIKLVPVKDWARIMGISIWTARGMAYKGRISSVKCGTKLLIPASEADRIVRENCRPAIAR
jgi:hypothetical protein